jgi:hypothetical protein
MRRLVRWIAHGVLLAVLAAMLAHGPIHQLAHYHDFADTRDLFGVPNAADVLSNAGFAAVGIWGLVALGARRNHPSLSLGWSGYALFLAALVATAFGSAYYHLAPDNARLVWDRLPIALACVGLLAGVHADTRHRSTPAWALAAASFAAAASVGWWWLTERAGAGDLRPYLYLQVLPLVLVPAWQASSRSPRADRIAFGIAIALYVAAKIAELGDRAIFDALGFMSGHTLKHLLSVAASAVLAGRLAWRARSGASLHGRPFPGMLDPP